MGFPCKAGYKVQGNRFEPLKCDDYDAPEVDDDDVSTDEPNSGPELNDGDLSFGLIQQSLPRPKGMRHGFITGDVYWSLEQSECQQWACECSWL